MSDDASGHEKKVDAYSTYAEVSSQVHDDVMEAVRAFAFLNSKWTENQSITPQSKSKTKQAILKISKRLMYEVKISRHGDESLEEIYERWSDSDGEPGYITRLERDSISNEPWLSQLVDDVVESAWQLGYLRAGRLEQVAQDADAEDAEQVKEMFD